MPELLRGPLAWADRRHAWLVLAALGLAAVNLTFRLSHEMIQVWDESLYATTALEMLRSGNWIVTTFQGAPDYYNSKPPLNVWLIALSFKAFGVSLLALRLPSALAAWLTVLAVYVWSRRQLGPRVAVLAALVLGTTYGFLYTHSGRTANADAPLTLVITLTFMTAWNAQRRPRVALWLGPLAAIAVMLKGPGALALMAPFAVADLVEAMRARPRLAVWAAPRLAGLALGALPVGLWAYARWHYDGWRFFSHMIGYDALARVGSALEGHAESPFYFLDVLQRHEYEWLIVAALAVLAAPSALGMLWRWLGASPARSLMPAWLVAGIGLPTLMSTKLSWYLNPFFPLLAMAVAAAVWHGWSTLVAERRVAVARAFAAVVVLAFGVAETTLAWHSYRRLDLGRSAQGLLIEHAGALDGHRVFAERCPYPEAFLAAAAGARCVPADLAAFEREAVRGDLWIGDR